VLPSPRQPSSGSPQRLLVYNLDSETALFRSDVRQRAGTDLEVTVGGQTVADPCVVSFRVESRSRRDIRPDDFVDTQPVIFEMAAPILKILNSDTGGNAMPDVPVAIDATCLTIGPALIKSKQAIKIDLLTDGPVSVTCPRPALVDIVVRQRPNYSGPDPSWYVRLRRAVGVAVIVGIALLLVGHALKITSLLTSGALLAIIPPIVLLAAGVITTLVYAHRGGWMRGPRTVTPDDPSPSRPC
jgi:hypothetical protein